MKRKILFVCVHNSARSQMAEAFVNKMCAKVLEAYSAGIEPGELNPLAVDVMKEIGFDISRNKTKSVSDILKSGMAFSRVITVCDEADAGRCPVFPIGTARLLWSFPDPSTFQGTHQVKLDKFRAVRDAIKAKIEQWCSVVCSLEAGC